MKLLKIFLITVVGSLAVSCYNDFDMPKPAPIYNDDVMEALGMEHISIYDLKTKFGKIDGTGSTNVTDGLDKTMYKRFVLDKVECTDWELSTGRYIEGNYYIKGKVISNDEQGNIYKSLYIYDGTGAIELKLTNGLFLDYYCDLDKMESQWVYVKLYGLYMGNFRMMLSIGDIPTQGLNSFGREKFYPNSNIVSPIKVREHVFPGERVALTKGVLAADGSNKNDYDILTINSTNYEQLLYKNSDEGRKYFGRLMSFEGVTVAYRGVDTQKYKEPDYVKPETLDGEDGFYPSWICTSGTITGFPVEYKSLPWGKLAYSNNNVSLYGQMVVGFGDNAKNATKKSEAGVYVVRTSGYSRYAGKIVPRDGATGNILAIYSIYSKSASQGYEAYQLTPCRFDDIFPKYYEEQTDEELAEMEQWAMSVTDGGAIPDDSYYLPTTINEDDAEE